MGSLRALVRLLLVVLFTLLVLIPALASRLPLLLGARGPAMWWASRTQQVWGRVCCFLMGIHQRVEGEGPRGRFLVAANHLSYIDIFVVGGLTPCRFIAKSEIAGWPVIGLMAQSVGTLFIRQAQRRDLQRVGAEMDATLQAGVSVALFPEGGASRGARIEKLHSSLFEGLVGRAIPCWVATLHYHTPHEPWGEAWTVCWWGGMELWRHLWRLLTLRRIEATIRWTEVETAGRDRKQIAQGVRDALTSSFSPIRQKPVPDDCPWPDLVHEQESNAG